jgi:hypothetical protein
VALAVAEILEEWRRAERVVELLPRTAPERATIEADVEALRATYRRLTTSTIPRTSGRIDSSLRHIEQIRARLEEIHVKYAIGPSDRAPQPARPPEPPLG